VATVAGSGPGNIATGSYSGDGGQAVAAHLNLPTSVGLDAAGNLYISDSNFRIRRVDAGTGIIHTIAGNGVRGYSGDGGSAVAWEMTTPAGLTVDPAGRVYVADLFNQRVRILVPMQTPPHLLMPARAR